MKRISVSIVAALIVIASGAQAYGSTIFPALGITDPLYNRGNSGTVTLEYGWMFTVNDPVAITDLDVYDSPNTTGTVPSGVVITVGLFCVANCGGSVTAGTEVASTTFGSLTSAETYSYALNSAGSASADIYQTISPVKLAPGAEYEVEATGFTSAFKADQYAINLTNYPTLFTGTQYSVTYLTSDGTLSGGRSLPTSPLGYLHGTATNPAQDYQAGSFEFIPTPEPGTLLLMGTGVLGLAGMVRRKFRKTAA